MRAELPKPFELRKTLAGLIVAVSPEGETNVAREMVPANPPVLVRVTLDVPDCPAKIVMLVGIAATEKSPTLTITWTWCDREPPTAVTVSV